MIKDGGPAFPFVRTYRQAYEDRVINDGMTLRDWFAGMAACGMGSAYILDRGPTASRTAQLAYELADAMIKERDRK